MAEYEKKFFFVFTPCPCHVADVHQAGRKKSLEIQEIQMSKGQFDCDLGPLNRQLKIKKSPISINETCG